jgi:polyribonucleotide nucleotidyltransferase
VRVGLVDGKLVANPTTAEQKTSLLNIVVVATEQAIVMIEAGATEVSEDSVADALEFGHEQIKLIIAAIRQLHDKVKPNKVTVPPLPFDEALAREIEQKYGAKLHDAIDTKKYPKKESYHLIDEVKKSIKESIPEEDEEKRTLAMRAFERLRENYFREDILQRQRRLQVERACRDVHAGGRVRDERQVVGSRSDEGAELGAGLLEQPREPAGDQLDRLALELELPRLVALEDRPRAGAERAMVEEDDVGIEKKELAHAAEYVVRQRPYRE